MARHWQRVTQPAAVRQFMTADALLMLEQLMRREHTVSTLAQHTRRPLNAAHHRVQKLLQTGLIRETRQETRRGRPIRHYRATADAYLIPYDHTPLNTLEDLIGLHEDAFQRHFHHAIVQAGRELVTDERDIGLRFSLHGDQLTWDVTPQAERFNNADMLRGDAPAIHVHWGELHLTRQDAKVLQHELKELITRYEGKTGPERYLFRSGLAPDVPDEG